MPATALPAGVTLVIVGCGLDVALGSYRLLLACSEQLLSRRDARAAMRRNNGVLVKGDIGVPAS